MGESEKGAMPLSCNRFLRVAFQGSRVTANGGAASGAGVGRTPGIGELIEPYLVDSRANHARFSFAELLRQSVYSRLAGYEEVNDAEQLSRDPTFRLIGWEKVWERGAALPSRLQTFETDLLAEEENFAGLARVNRELIGKAEAIKWQYRTVLAMSTVPRTGKNCCCRRSSAICEWGRKSHFGPMRPLPSRRFMKRWRSGV
ncbi:MAG: transposase [Acidobacteria bacterium]|nr:transposase [Acidobacteriota bacterium]